MAAKKKAAKKSTKSTAAPKIPKASGVRTKSAVMAGLAEGTGLSKKQVGSVFDALHTMIGQDLKGSKIFTLPGLAKITVVHKPATKARKGINPFTGLETMFKAKAARNVVKVRPLKALKDMV